MFERVVRELLGPDISFEIAPPEEIVNEDTGEILESNPRIVVRSGLTLELARMELIVEGSDPAVEPLVALGVRVRRLYDLTRYFPVELDLRHRTVTASIDMPSDGPAWRQDGLWAKISITSDGAELSSDHLFITAAALGDDDFDAQYSDFNSRIWHLEGLAEVRTEDLTFGAARRLPDDEAYPRLLEELGLTDEIAVRSRVASVLAQSFATLEDVRARYMPLYDLPLPSGFAFAAALVQLLAELPKEAPGIPKDWLDTKPGWRRGSRWLDEAVAMRSSGLLDWFAPGGVARSTIAIAAMFRDQPPPHEEGRFDPRLDMRYRCDPPQFVTFMSGNSDGEHWGLWYDSPRAYPRIAHNFARDGAETSIEDEATIPEFLRARVAAKTDEALEQIRDNDEERAEDASYMVMWRTLRIVDVLLTELERALAERPAPEEPLCPWPRSEQAPIGIPKLALPPGSGEVPATVPGYTFSTERPTTATLTDLIADARAALDAGKPAFAYALGLHLHWHDDDDLRSDAAALLQDAYRALDFAPFAEILALHVRYRDMGSVGVFEKC